MDKMIDELKKLKKEYDKKYGVGIFQITPSEEGKRLLIEGEVLLESQLERAKIIAKKHFSGHVLSQVRILSDRSIPAACYGKGVDETVDVYSKYVKNIEALSATGKTRNRSTQALKVDPPFRILKQVNDMFLIQLFDDTIGWVEKSKVKKVESCTMPEYKRTIHFKRLRESIDGYMGVPYLWGGTSKKGLDCSGFIQRAFLESSQMRLPKNSQHQMLLGKKVSIQMAKVGDLFFFQEKIKKIPHVGILVNTEGNQIAHCCLKNKKVTINTLDEMLSHYRLTDVKRI